MNNQQSGQLINAHRIEMLKRVQEEVMESKERVENRDNVQKDEQQNRETESLIQREPRVLDKRMYDTFAGSFTHRISSVEKEIEYLKERLSTLGEKRGQLAKELQELDDLEHSLNKRMRLMVEIKDRLDQWVLFLHNPDIP
jgi:DNA repair exonuclease SbcCD ATPase subunit